MAAVANKLQTIAADYADHGLGVHPALPWSKEPAGQWRVFQWQAPSKTAREALFSVGDSLNIGAFCGAASNNLAVLDCETPRAFEATLRRVDRAGYGNTWLVKTMRGGHIHLRTPVPVRPIGKTDDVEVRAQGQFILLPWSHHPDDPRRGNPSYQFIHRSPEIAQLESLRELDWLTLEPAPLAHRLPLPRKARRHLKGKLTKRYESRSEAEQSIVTVLVNTGFTFEQILSLFRLYPAAGKFAEIQQNEGPECAARWLLVCFEFARDFCAKSSPARSRALLALNEALSSAWPGRTGSTDKSVFCAHATLAYRAGREVYHASSRDLAELAGCQRNTASAACRRLEKEGLLQRVDGFSPLYASRYRLTQTDHKVSENAPLPTTLREGVAQTSSFLLPDAFRGHGLGRSAYEVIVALNGDSRTVSDLADKTGRHPQTVRAALKAMERFAFVSRCGRLWAGCDPSEIDARAEELGLNGALQRQREKHQGERLRYGVTQALLRHRQREAQRA